MGNELRSVTVHLSIPDLDQRRQRGYDDDMDVPEVLVKVIEDAVEAWREQHPGLIDSVIV